MLIDKERIKDRFDFYSLKMWPEDLAANIQRIIDEEPIVDAIPVEWLREFDLYYAGISGGSPYFRELMAAWQKEQEAR